MSFATQKGSQLLALPEGIILSSLRKLHRQCATSTGTWPALVLACFGGLPGGAQHMLAGVRCDGRRLQPQVTEYDCLLLEHVFGNRPADAVKVSLPLPPLSGTCWSHNFLTLHKTVPATAHAFAAHRTTAAIFLHRHSSLRYKPYHLQLQISAHLPDHLLALVTSSVSQRNANA